MDDHPSRARAAELPARYAAAVDARDLDALRALLAERATMTIAGPDARPTVGREAVIASLSDMLPAGLSTRHFLANTRIDETGPGLLRVDCAIHYLHEGPGFEGSGHGDYEFTVDVSGADPLITDLVFHPGTHTSGSLGALVERLGRLEDVEAARMATWRYATAVDTLDFDMLADAFTEDAVLTSSSGVRRGRDAIVEHYRAALADPVARKHFLVNPRVSWNGPGDVTVDSVFSFTYVDDTTSLFGWGDYRDRIRVEDGVGRIAEKDMRRLADGDIREGWTRR